MLGAGENNTSFSRAWHTLAVHTEVTQPAAFEFVQGRGFRGYGESPTAALPFLQQLEFLRLV